jgi:hypothetical protein
MIVPLQILFCDLVFFDAETQGALFGLLPISLTRRVKGYSRSMGW